jgi:lipid-binding SYLF domain-containing protein
MAARWKAVLVLCVLGVLSFSQKGLMAGLGLQGSKITKINP